MYLMVNHSQGAFVAPKAVADPSHLSMDTCGCYAICTPARVYLWVGTRCPPGLAAGGRVAVEKLQRYVGAAAEVVEVRQGHETADFWASIGGVGEVTDKENQQAPQTPPVLGQPAQEGELSVFYHFVDPEWDKYDFFDEDDLETDGIFVLYVPQHIWVWIGPDYRGEGGVVAEQVDGLLVARRFMDDLSLPHEGSITIIKHVDQESDEFLSHFH